MVIGRALLTRPRVLLLDEPTTGLDPAIRRELWALIRDIRDQGCTVILTTHYVEEAERLCGRVGIINRGRLVAIGSPAELTARFGAARLEDVVIDLTAGAAS
ncbi:multidrug ABC transporter ATPase [Magnetospirillum fulvum MGU-K5]|uniref:Multidrug ABC transporter ATPase n=1 Tax=Magnetospirillum fulvum MGU-K5 TaxID=1316936 RepID=S9SAV9_MAGFU|nr:multidrug ABC transporter ATPase [Magnetospirillum fulvum MGU-K5]